MRVSKGMVPNDVSPGQNLLQGSGKLRNPLPDKKKGGLDIITLEDGQHVLCVGTWAIIKC